MNSSEVAFADRVALTNGMPQGLEPHVIAALRDRTKALDYLEAKETQQLRSLWG
jgi:hypothetical protein